jgi:Uncharacterized protein conserved in bacteria
MAEEKLVSALLSGKCPRCRRGDIFAYPATSLTRFNKMNEKCPNCELRFQPEPGFYQGAMYIGYAFTVAVMVIVGLTLYFLGDPSEWVYIGTVIAIMILLVPWNYRYSRIVYLYAFGGIKYDPNRYK